MTSAGLTRVLVRKQFRQLFLGISLSRIGDAMTFTVVSWIALGVGGPRAVGLVLLAGGVAAPVAAPVIGALLDRLGLRLLLLADNLGRAALLVALAAFVQAGDVRLGHLVVVSVLSALLSPATEIGQTVAVPVLVEPGELTAANTLLATSWDLAAWLGPAVAGLAMAAAGPAPVLLLDAATFLGMALAARAMPSGPVEQGEGNAFRRLDGFRLLWRMRPVAVLTAVTVANLFLGGMLEVFLPAYSASTLHGGPAQYGALVSVAGLGCLAGTLLLTPLVDRLGSARALAVVLAARAVALLPLAVAGSWAVAAVVLAAASVPDGPFFPISRTLLQRLVPAPVQGRVAGARGALGAAGFPLGAAAGGVLVAAAGTGVTVGVLAAGYLASAGAVLLGGRDMPAG